MPSWKSACILSLTALTVSLYNSGMIVLENVVRLGILYIGSMWFISSLKPRFSTQLYGWRSSASIRAILVVIAVLSRSDRPLSDFSALLMSGCATSGLPCFPLSLRNTLCKEKCLLLRWFASGVVVLDGVRSFVSQLLHVASWAEFFTKCFQMALFVRSLMPPLTESRFGGPRFPADDAGEIWEQKTSAWFPIARDLVNQLRNARQNDTDRDAWTRSAGRHLYSASKSRRNWLVLRPRGGANEARRIYRIFE